MGQYYKPVNLDKNEWIYSHNFDNGLKLMEHSYIGNHFINAIEILLTPKGDWYKSRLVWAGDYADPEKEESEFIPKDYDGEFDENHPNIWDLVDVNGHEIAPYEIDKLKEDEEINLDEYNFICNHTKKVFFDKRKVISNIEENNLKIHPLPLLLAEGNGRGGGDYHKEYPNFELVGLWSRDSVSVESEPPKDYKEENYKFIETNAHYLED